MFVILFGLSMDYHVFILSRVREAYDRGMKTEDAVAHGIKTTAGVVSSAALVMVGVFSIFATLPIIDMKEMGIGLAAAVLIDATIVRAVLLPATMKLLGDWNWYLPNWLGWLPEARARRRGHGGARRRTRLSLVEADEPRPGLPTAARAFGVPWPERYGKPPPATRSGRPPGLAHARSRARGCAGRSSGPARRGAAPTPA